MFRKRIPTFYADPDPVIFGDADQGPIWTRIQALAKNVTVFGSDVIGKNYFHGIFVLSFKKIGFSPKNDITYRTVGMCRWVLGLLYLFMTL